MFNFTENYKNNLDYDVFPAATEQEQVWYLADDGYNSNSFVSGLLKVLNLEVPYLSKKTPGYDKPVPAKNFYPERPSFAHWVYNSVEFNKSDEEK